MKTFSVNTESPFAIVIHSPSFGNMNNMQPEKTPGYFSGGNPLRDMEKNIVLTRNITMYKESGMGNGSEEQFCLSGEIWATRGQTGAPVYYSSLFSPDRRGSICDLGVSANGSTYTERCRCDSGEITKNVKEV